MNRTNSVNVGGAAKSAALLTYRHLCFISCNEEVIMASLTHSTWCHLLHTLELHLKYECFIDYHLLLNATLNLSNEQCCFHIEEALSLNTAKGEMIG